MIYELKENEYEKVRSVFRELRKYNLAINSVIEGNTLGRVYVDDLTNPKTAFIWVKDRGSGFYLEGCENNNEFNISLNNSITEEIYPEAKQLRNVHDFTLCYFPKTWENRIDVILRNTFPMKNHRKFYTFREPKVHRKDILPSGFCVKRVDEKLLERARLKNINKVNYWVKDSWHSIGNFMKQGFGLCLLYGDEIVSWCMADYVSGERCEIGLQTDEKYRRRGLATLTVAATVDYCLSKNFSNIGWHCWSSNLASAATAEKVGFERTLDHPVYHAWFNEFDNLLVHGNISFRRKQFKESAESYEEAFKMREVGEKNSLSSSIFSKKGVEKWYYYNSACAWALAGKRDSAVRNLTKAIDKGWTDIEGIMKDDNLRSLHQEKSWKELISKLQKQLDNIG